MPCRKMGKHKGRRNKMNGKHAIYRVYQALCAGMLSLFPAGRQTLVQGDGCITRIPELLKTHGIKGVQVITTPGTKMCIRDRYNGA